MNNVARTFTYACFATFLSASKLYHNVVYTISNVIQPVCSIANE